MLGKVYLEGLFGLFGGLEAFLLRSWVVLGGLGVVLEAVLCRLAWSWGGLGAVWVGLGRFRGGLGAVLGASWVVL